LALAQFAFKVNPNVDIMKLRGDQRTNKTPYMVALTDVRSLSVSISTFLQRHVNHSSMPGLGLGAQSPVR
jgi:hypothetical protein